MKRARRENRYEPSDPDRRRMTDDESVQWFFGQKAGIAILIALLAQAGSSIWWASSMTTHVEDHDKHLETLDEVNKKSADAVQQMSERLTRVEEQQKSAQQSLNRIETILSATAPVVTHGR